MSLLFKSMVLLLFLFFLCLSQSLCVVASSFSESAGGDLGLSIGSSAATKLVRNALDGFLRAPRFIELDLASTKSPLYRVANVIQLNRVTVDALEVQFNDSQIRLEARDLMLNSTSLINMTALPILLDGKRVKLNAVVKKAFLRVSIEQEATLRVQECELDYSDVELYLERSFFLNLLLSVVRGTMSETMLRDHVCSLLLDTMLDLHEKYLIQIPFAQLIPRKFVPFLLSPTVHLRSRLESVVADGAQIIVTAIVDWIEEAPTHHSSSFLSSLPMELYSNDEMESRQQNLVEQSSAELLEQQTQSVEVEGTKIKGPNQNSIKKRPKRDKSSNNPNPKRRDAMATQAERHIAVSERLLLWMNDTVMNDLLKQFRWDFKLIEERIPLNSSKLPTETREFFANICPQCVFIFNISADGLPSIIIDSNSIVAKIHNRIAAEVLNPTLGVSGQKKTAIDLSLSLEIQMVPQIKDGIFHTRLNLIERKIDMKNGTAFPRQMKSVVEGLLQDMIKDDLWPAVKRELEPLIYNKGVELPSHCGVNPKSALLHFEPGKFGVSASLNIKGSSFVQCVSQFKSKLPSPSELFKIKSGDGASSSLGELAQSLKKR